MGHIPKLNASLMLKYRNRLSEWLAETQAEDERGRDAQKIVTLDQQSVGRLSRMDALQHQAMANAAHVRRAQMETRIISALARIDDGEYGYCLDCGDDIATARLDLDPTVPKCLSCATG